MSKKVTDERDAVRSFVNAGHGVSGGEIQQKFGFAVWKQRRITDWLKQKGLIDKDGLLFIPIDQTASAEPLDDTEDIKEKSVRLSKKPYISESRKHSSGSKLDEKCTSCPEVPFRGNTDADSTRAKVTECVDDDDGRPSAGSLQPPPIEGAGSENGQPDDDGSPWDVLIDINRHNTPRQILSGLYRMAVWHEHLANKNNGEYGNCKKQGIETELEKLPLHDYTWQALSVQRWFLFDSSGKHTCRGLNLNRLDDMIREWRSLATEVRRTFIKDLKYFMWQAIAQPDPQSKMEEIILKYVPPCELIARANRPARYARAARRKARVALSKQRKREFEEMLVTMPEDGPDPVPPEEGSPLYD